MTLDKPSLRTSRRLFGKTLLGAAAVGATSSAKAQYASGNGRYVPYNCTATSSVKVYLPVYYYTCRPVSDISLLSLALNLEYLEASFYLYATTGVGLSAGDKGDQPGNIYGARQATLTSPVVSAFARELAVEERQHVELLRNTIVALNMVPVSIPSIDFTEGFNYVMQQAGIAGAGTTFDAFANDTNFLLAAYVLEDLLVSAYRGAVPLIRSPALLDLVSGLLGTEGYHAGSLRALLFGLGAGSATNAISNVRYKLDGTAGTPAQGNDHGVGTLTAPSIANVDGAAIVEGRTTQQVVAITYDAGADSSPTLRLPRYFFTTGLSSPY